MPLRLEFDDEITDALRISPEEQESRTKAIWHSADADPWGHSIKKL